MLDGGIARRGRGNLPVAIMQVSYAMPDRIYGNVIGRDLSQWWDKLLVVVGNATKKIALRILLWAMWSLIDDLGPSVLSEVEHLVFGN